MALTGIQIFKLLPKTNCGECGVPTCLAFAMNLAAAKAELASCPYISAESKAQLSEASAPPIRPVAIGTGDNVVKIGGETVLFRHEKTFVNKPGLAVMISDAMTDDEVNGRIKRFKELRYDWIGLVLRPEMIAVKNESGDAGRYETLVKKVMDETDAALILMSDSAEALKAALQVSAQRVPLIYAAAEGNAEAMAGLAKEYKCPLAAKADNMDSLAALTDKISAAGVKDIVLDSGARTVRRVFEDQVFVRRAALVQKNRSLGFPTIAFPCEMTKDPMKETLIAATLIAKYAGIIVLSDFQGESLFPLLVSRLNIYTDPQRPMMMQQGIYPVGNPTEDSPVLITTNFALTYFIVSGEIEASRVPSWLLVMDTEGLSVLTAWAAGKFVGDAIGQFVKKSGITEKVKHRKIVIPGFVAAVSGDLEEELGSEWEVKIGPREAAHLAPFLKQGL
ncbi:MAG: acetyl-CoA decarbonylase/synthase complex subunit gamma [Syntrophus sp. RIFOXYC2_FULL_54_9]|nr:MAG: acetyl-CoA decarbonylase/synthase complex subunit gamma [Syntrophus sp. GWC2_56_31]OHE27987.1 MAG: acetyl-CoA decarbonylase/synthase complex subunit gamma [Syntrophus sp. RIFOXYC2_FULL_54_9]HBB17085.1 acetyl-CoA decarbonylase/synthase complex subunit gamma [Syntrophus sp. (in: bacteria)]